MSDLDSRSSRSARHSILSLIKGLLAPLAALAIWVSPLPLSEHARPVAAITAAVLIAWVTEVIPLAVTSVLIAPLLIVTRVMPAKQAFAAYADPILFLFIGSFFAAKAMSRHGLDRRFALGIAGLRMVRGHPARMRGAIMVGAMLLSMWISNTGATAILLPVLLGLLPQKRDDEKLKTFAAGSLLGLAHASTTGGLATLVGTPPNAITARLLAAAHHPVGFLTWMKVGVPTMLVLTTILYWLIGRLFPARDVVIEFQTSEVSAPWSRAEKVTAASFALAVIGWVVPDLAQTLGIGGSEVLAKMLDPGAVAILAASLLFMVPTGPGGPRVLTWEDAVRIEWGLILLFGGGIALGEAMLSTGLAATLGRGLIALTGVSELWSLTFVAILVAIALTEICSNTAAANMLVPLVIGAAIELGVSPVPPAIAVGLGASCGFMLPVATGPNAIAYGTGFLRVRDMMRVGVLLDLVSAVVIFVLLRILCPWFGIS
jgi:sodium-dependent dicarboxylate transporter 2/3/5